MRFKNTYKIIRKIQNNVFARVPKNVLSLPCIYKVFLILSAMEKQIHYVQVKHEYIIKYIFFLKERVYII